MEGGKIVAEQIRKNIEKVEFKYQDHVIPLTFTFCVSIYNTIMNIGDCIKKADQALYKGKRKGRNCVVLFKEDDVLIG